MAECKTTTETLKQLRDAGATVEQLKAAKTVMEQLKVEITKETKVKPDIYRPPYYKIENKYEFTPAYHDANRIANKFVADAAVAFYKKSDDTLGPKIEAWHNKQMAKKGIYATVYKTIIDGTRDMELLNKIMQQLFLTGDTNRSKIAKLTKMVDDMDRWAMQTLTTEMPEWDKKLLAAIVDKDEQVLLNAIYGLSGYGSMSQYVVDSKTVLEWVQEGIAPSEVLAKMKLTSNEIKEAESLHDRLVNRVVQNYGYVNTSGNNRLAAIVALKALEANNNAGYKLHTKMMDKHPELHAKLVESAIIAHTLNTMINRGTGRLSLGSAEKQTYSDYEEHGLLDLYSNSHEFKIVSKIEMDSGRYDENTFNPWKVLKEVNKNGFGIVYRKSQEVYNSGLGVNEDRIKNGLYISQELVEAGLKKDAGWLVNNNVQEYLDMKGNYHYRVILTKEQAIKAEGMNNIMQTLYRSVIHNTQLIEQQTVRQMIKAELTENGSSEARLDILENKLKYNANIKWANRADRKEVKPYLKTDMVRTDLKEKYPLIFKEYKIATGISTYGALNEELNYVRRGMSDIMLGYGTGTMLPDSMPWLQDMERKYKQLVVLKKLKLVAASPTKLLSDITSNGAVLGALDVDPIEGGRDMKQAFDYWDETSNIEAELVKLRMELLNAEAANNTNKIQDIKAKTIIIERKFKRHPFYEAYARGFVQSLTTSMMIKEFDTISGLQHTINETVKKAVLNDKGDPNIIHKAIVQFMHWGYSIEDVLKYAGNASKLKGTKFSNELIEMGNRLADHKRVGEEDVPAYISEIIAGPESEIVKQGTRIMQLADLMARWALYKHTLKELLSEELKRPVTADEIQNVIRGNRLGLSHARIEELKDIAGLRSLDTFVDVRLNIPSEFKILSDYFILRFPSFWLGTAVVVPQMIAAKPLNTMVTLAISGITGMPTIYESHPLWKAISSERSVANMPANVTTIDTFIPYWPSY